MKNNSLVFKKQLPSPFFCKEKQKTTLQDDINFYKEQIYYYRDCIEQIKRDTAQRIKTYYIEIDRINVLLKELRKVEKGEE